MKFFNQIYFLENIFFIFQLEKIGEIVNIGVMEIN